MQLNELLEQYSIKEISAKTRIAPENIEYLQGRDWDMMRKVQALGFIKILEREYGIDLSDLKKECIEYYSEHSQGLGGENLELHLEDSRKSAILNIAQKALVSIFVIALAAGSWYIFVGKKEESNELSQEVKEKKSGFYDAVIGTAHKLMGENNSSVASELAPTDSIAKKSKPKLEQESENVATNTTITDENTKEKIKLEYAKKPQEVAQKDTKSKQATNTTKEKEESKPLKITDVIPTVTQVSDSKNEEQNTQTVSQNSSESTESTTKETTTISDNDNIDDTSSMVSLLPEVPSLASNNTKATTDDTKAKEDKQQEQKATDGASVVIMVPGSKVWIGYRELRSGKRTAKVVKEPVKFDTKGSDYILATGHGVLTFKNGTDKELLKLHDGKKHFFMIAKGGVREISHEKFQQLNGSKVW